MALRQKRIQRRVPADVQSYEVPTPAILMDAIPVRPLPGPDDLKTDNQCYNESVYYNTIDSLYDKPVQSNLYEEPKF